MKLTLLIFALAGALGAATPDAAEQQRVRGLQLKSGVASRLPAEGAGSQETALAVAEAAAAALKPQAPATMQAPDYDALYSLLQRYREELRKLGFDQKELEDAMSSLKVREAELHDRVDKLHPLDGMKIHGRIINVYDDLLMTGSGYNLGRPTRYRHGLSRGELEFTMTRGRFTGVAEYQLQKVIDLYDDCVGCKSGLRSVYVEARTPLAVQAGDFNYKLTPLTVWRSEETDPDEAEIFSWRRESQHRDLKLGQNDWSVRGLRLSTDLIFFNAQSIELELFTTQMGAAGDDRVVYPNTQTPQGFAMAGKTLSNLYNTYLSAWAARVPLGSMVTVGYSGTSIYDSADSSNATNLAGAPIGGYVSQVNSGSLGLDTGTFAAGLEYAASQFSSPNMNPTGSTDYITGTAATGFLALHLNGGSLTLSAKAVSDTFISAPAQGLSGDFYDYPLGPFATENSTYNPSTGYYGSIGVPQPPESQIRSFFLAPQLLTDKTPMAYVFAPLFSYLLPSDPRRNVSDPYGDATPNRAGFKAELEQPFFSKGLILRGGAASSAEQVKQAKLKSALAYLDWHGGLAFDFEPWLGWKLKAGGGWASRDMRGGDIAFSTTTVDAGLSLGIGKDMTLTAGGKHWDGNGTIPYVGNAVPFAAFGMIPLRQVYDQGSLGMKIRFDEGMTLRLTYTSTLMNDLWAESQGTVSHFQADQLFGEAVIEF